MFQRDIYFGYNEIFLLLLLCESTFPEITSERCWRVLTEVLSDAVGKYCTMHNVY